MKTERSRNEIIDIIRGIAMLLVVAGHTIANSNLINYENNLLFKVIWALQMPLFILISGWVTCYSKPITSAKALVRYIGKKSLAYLLPWCVWTIGIRGFLLGGWTIHNFSQKLISLLWHMDSGYWFLTSLWTIQILWGISSYLCRRAYPAHALRKAVLTACITLGLAVFLLVLGHFVGYSFFGIKLTCYYLPFFLVGSVLPYLRTTLNAISGYHSLESIIVCLSVVLFLFLVISRNFYTAEDTILNILERVICSLCGCAGLAYIVPYLSNKMPRKLKTALAWIGSHTMELYLCHNLFIGLIDGRGMALNTLKGAGIAVVNFLLTLLLSAVLAALLGYSKFTRFIFFGKTSSIQITQEKSG